MLFFVYSFERKFTQDLRQQQDEAYELSLKADQEKERLKQLEKERLLQQQLQEEAEILEKQRQKEVIITLKYGIEFVRPIKCHSDLNHLLGYCKTKD